MMFSMSFSCFCFECTGNHRDLHVLTHPCPTRRASGLPRLSGCGACEVDVGEQDVVPRARRNLRDPRAHLPCPDNSDDHSQISTETLETKFVIPAKAGIPPVRFTETERSRPSPR